jgi:hypothetical protein
VICVTVLPGHSLPVMLEWFALLSVSEVAVSNIGVETLCSSHGFLQSFKGDDRSTGQYLKEYLDHVLPYSFQFVIYKSYHIFSVLFLNVP